MEMHNFLLKGRSTISVMYMKWDGGEGSVFNKCVNPELPPEEQSSKKWLRYGSLVHTTLKTLFIAKLCCRILKC